VKQRQGTAGSILLQITSWLNNFARKAGTSADTFVFGFAFLKPYVYPLVWRNGVLGDYMAWNKFTLFQQSFQ
jgi:hypothetical protein